MKMKITMKMMLVFFTKERILVKMQKTIFMMITQMILTLEAMMISMRCIAMKKEILILEMMIMKS